jgi:hypothetical protein
MALTKECGCWGCHKTATLPADLTQDDVQSAVQCCDDCEGAGCDPFEQNVPCRADHEQHEAGNVDGCDVCEDRKAEDVDVDERFPCPRDTCNGDGHLLGILGRLAHYRCRACGTEFHL